MIRTPKVEVSRPPPDRWDDESGVELAHIARMLFWAVLAACCLSGAFLAARTEIGSERIAAAWSALTAPPMKQTTLASTNQIAPPEPRVSVQLAPAVETTPRPSASSVESVSAQEVHALAEQVQNLSAERERLMARLDALEQSLDVTGSIRKPERERAGTDEGWTAVPVPLGRPTYTPFGNVPPFTPEPVTEWTVSKTEFGIDLGKAQTLDGLRSQWATVRTQHAALLEGLRPAVAIRETGGGGLELRLIVGPLNNAAYAARICVVLATAGRECRATAFDGQRLAAR